MDGHHAMSFGANEWTDSVMAATEVVCHRGATSAKVSSWVRVRAMSLLIHRYAIILSRVREILKMDFILCRLLRMDRRIVLGQLQKLGVMKMPPQQRTQVVRSYDDMRWIGIGLLCLKTKETNVVNLLCKKVVCCVSDVSILCVWIGPANHQAVIVWRRDNKQKWWVRNAWISSVWLVS